MDNIPSEEMLDEQSYVEDRNEINVRLTLSDRAYHLLQKVSHERGVVIDDAVGDMVETAERQNEKLLINPRPSWWVIKSDEVLFTNVGFWYSVIALFVFIGALLLYNLLSSSSYTVYLARLVLRILGDFILVVVAIILSAPFGHWIRLHFNK